MGNVCPSGHLESDKHVSNFNSVASKNKKSLASSVFIDENGSTRGQKEEQHVWSQSGAGVQNSFARKNEIGPYFCGGSLFEREALSYPKRVQMFENIIKESQKDKRKKEKLQSSKTKSILESSGMRKDMDQTFQQKFNFLPGLLSVNPKTLQKSIKKGPPIKYRWVSWKSHLFSISDSLSIEKTKKELEHLQFFSSKEEIQIEKDINRTFPTQPYFSASILQHNIRCNDSIIGYLPLKRVLIGISNLYPKLGYCQGMNFILGFILLINGANEAEAFWMFKILAEHPDFMLMGLYEDELPFLKFLEYLAKELLKIKLKDLMEYFEDQDIPDSFWLTKWFLTLFLYNFPPKICSRLWDYFITNDVFSLIKLMIPILDVFKHIFMEKDACQFMECFTELTQDEEELSDPKSEFFFNLTEIIQKADSFKIEKKTIAKYAHEYLVIEPENEYAKLYSLYDDEKGFQKAHAQIIKTKVINVEETFSSLIESGKLTGDPGLQTQMIKEVSAEYQCSPAQIKDKQQERTLSNRKTGIGFENSQTTMNESGQDKEKEATKEESEEDKCSEIYLHVQEQIKDAQKIEEEQKQQQQEETTSPKDADQSHFRYTSGSPNKSQIKRTQTKADELRDHLATMELDAESYNMFQSLANKSPEFHAKKMNSSEFYQKNSFEAVDNKTEAEGEKYLNNRINLVSMSSVSSNNSIPNNHQYPARLFAQSELEEKSSTHEIFNLQIT